MNQLHYPDLERCKKLTELGFPMTEKTWGVYKTGKYVRGSVVEFEYANVKQLLIGDTFPKKDVVCPSVMEMMDVIPEEIKKGFIFGIERDGKWRVRIQNDNRFNSVGDTYPDAFASMIIEAVELGFITFDKRLRAAE